MTTFIDYGDLPEAVRAALLALEVFIGDMDGCVTDDGTVDAEDAVVAFNAIVTAIRAAPATPEGSDKP